MNLKDNIERKKPDIAGQILADSVYVKLKQATVIQGPSSERWLTWEGVARQLVEGPQGYKLAEFIKVCTYNLRAPPGVTYTLIDQKGEGMGTPGRITYLSVELHRIPHGGSVRSAGSSAPPQPSASPL